MSTTFQTTTADELLLLPRGNIRHELVKGELRTMSPAGSEHGAVVWTISLRVGRHVQDHDLGVCFGAETGFLLARDPDTVRAPDLAFVQKNRIPPDGIPQGYWSGAPDLAVEVVSPSDRISEIDDKARDWLHAGALAVWVVNPVWKTVTEQGQRSLTLGSC